jgi:glycine/D-amino acid oxidase-like deaminating enzyme
MHRLPLVILLFALSAVVCSASEIVLLPTSERQVPIAAEVDVVVVGGGISAVAAALSAAEAGASVAISTPMPFFDETIAGTGRYWLLPGDGPLSPLGERLFEDCLMPALEPDGARHVHPARWKRRLDELLVRNGAIQVYFQSYASEVLRGSDGRLAGVCIANKAGRQALLARVIIDASPLAAVARMAGAHFEAWPEDARIRAARGTTWDASEVSEHGSTMLRFRSDDQREVVLQDHVLEAPLAAPVWPDLVALALAHRHRFDAARAQWAGHMLQLSEPVAILARATGDGAAAALPLDACRPRDMEQLYVLGGACAVSRARAEQLQGIAESIVLGERIGAAAAAEAAATTPVPGPRVHLPEATAAATAWDCREQLDGIRPLQEFPSVSQPAGGLPLWGDYDVVVVGGGTAGPPAAIAAARSGASVLLIEMSGILGGVGSNGIGWAFRGYKEGGFAAEWVQAAFANFRAAHLDDYLDDSYFNRVGNKDMPFMFAQQRNHWLIDQLRQAGADLWFTSMGVGVWQKENEVGGVVVASHLGRGVVRAKVVIDATGDGDIATAAGSAYLLVDAEHGHVQHAAYSGDAAIVSGFENDNTAPFHPADVLAAVDFARSNRARPKYGPEHDNHYDFYYQLMMRESRRIICDYMLNYRDQALLSTFTDVIAVTTSSYDQHGDPSSIDFFLGVDVDRAENMAAKARGLPSADFQSTPYRALLPVGLEGLLVTGRCRGSTHDGLSQTRMQVDMMNEGYAAGLCAAQAAASNSSLRSIDLAAVQEQLLANRAIPHAELIAAMPEPSEAELAAAAADPRDYHAALLLAWPERARSHLQQAFAAEPSLERAGLLAVLGDHVAVPYLVQAISSEDPTERQAMTAVLASKIGNMAKPGLRTAVWALGAARDPRAVPALVALLQAAKIHARRAEPARSLALALARIGDEQAIPALQAAFESIPERARENEGGFNLALALHACGVDMSAFFQAMLRHNDRLQAQRAATVLDSQPGTPLGQ